MAGTDSQGKNDSLSADSVYRETCFNIRATDDISFKLMGTVPLLSGAAILTVFLKGPIEKGSGPVVVALSMFAAFITLGLFRWELRNIQTCSWHRRRIEALESKVAVPLPKQPTLPHRIGKTEAEKWIYSVTIIALLLVPVVVSPGPLDSWLLGIYIGVSLMILVATVISASATVRVKP